MRLFKRFKRAKEDSGAANTIGFLMILVVTVIMVISFIDIGMFYSAKGELKTAAENGADNVALYGGTAGSFRAAMYNKASADKKPSTAEALVVASIKSKYDVKVNDNSRNGSKVSIVDVNAVECGPDKARAGEPVWCKVTYKYNGIAGKFSIFNIGNQGDKVVYGTAISEVNVK